MKQMPIVYMCMIYSANGSTVSVAPQFVPGSRWSQTAPENPSGQMHSLQFAGFGNPPRWQGRHEQVAINNQDTFSLK
jgi:hypothetical protein